MPRTALPSGLPIDAVLPALAAALAGNPAAVLEAPPGAGKTTIVPLALREAPWLAGRRILMLEPRRIAARAAAARMAGLLGEKVGESVGYHIRLERRIGPRTRIEVLTEGLLTRRLQSDPALEGVGLVIFDEFHERSLAADLGLAFARETQGALNETLRLLVMSATLDGARVSALLGGAPVIRAEGRAFPVDTRYRPRRAGQRLPDEMAAAIRAALRETEGGILAFLPGEGEIRSVVRALGDDLPPDVQVLPLYGALGAEAQDRAVAPASPGQRKIVLATAIAETSLTIEDVRVVIDSGEARRAEFDPVTGMTRLVTSRVSLAAAEQRRGRAGRVAPGVCYRLWAEPETRALKPFSPPEMLVADLAPLALELAVWGARDPAALALLDPPPPAALMEARALLERLGALDADGLVTSHGRAMAGVGAHPRLAHMMLAAAPQDTATACALAAILTERDLIRASGEARDTDMRLRLQIMAGDAALAPGQTLDRAVLARAKAQSQVWARSLRAHGGPLRPEAAGRLIALAYPDRIAQSRGEPGTFRLANGRGARLPLTDPLAAAPGLAIAELDGAASGGRIYLAAPLALAEIEDLFDARLETRDEIAWDDREGAVKARRETRLDALVLRSRPLTGADPAALTAAVLDGLRRRGLDALAWTRDLRALQARAAFVRRVLGDAAPVPDLSDTALLADLDAALGPYLNGVTRAADFARIDLAAALEARLGWEARRTLDRLAPAAIEVPSGSRLPIDYSGETPVLAVRLQELFGLAETPRVGDGRVPLTLHLLSPAHRPVQVTTDLRSFWTTTYADVKKDLKGRYPKHHWPDDPWTAQPTARAKRRGT